MTTGATQAYVFWHWRRPQVAAAEYEARQRGFHRALAAYLPDGFSHLTSSVVVGAPWANGGDGAASVTAGGTAGLYRPRIGTPLATPRYALWFAKPPGMSYDQLLGRCGPVVRAGESVLWMRRLVLGPTPEFCLESTTTLTLPPEFRTRALSLQPVWRA